MSKAFLHLGAHKTATTFLQANFTANRKAFEKQGWTFVCFQRKARELRSHVRRARKGAEMRAEDEAPLEKFFSELRAERHNIFFSSEIFLGQMNPARTGRIYPHHAAMIDTLKRHFAGKDVRIGFCVREFSEYLESGYNWLVSYGSTGQDFQEYSRKTTAKKMTWLPILEKFADTFGNDNLVVWTYEDFRKNAVKGLREIARTAGVDPVNFDVQDQPRNVSMRPEQVMLMSKWNKALREHDDLPKETRIQLNAKFRALLAEIPPLAKPVFHLEPKKRTRFQARYQEELEQIRARWGKNMLTFGSPRDKPAIGAPMATEPV